MEGSTEITVTVEQLRAAFTEWDTRYRNNPEEFMDIAYHLLHQDADDYGNAAAPYFVSLLNELKGN